MSFCRRKLAASVAILAVVSITVLVFRLQIIAPLILFAARDEALKNVAFYSRVASYQNCLMVRRVNATSSWFSLKEAVRNCVFEFTSISRENSLLFHVGRHNEKRFLLRFPDRNRKQVGNGNDNGNNMLREPRNCVLLTIGIDTTVTAEELLVKTYPRCKAYGVEPNATKGGSFIKVGTYFPFGIIKKAEDTEKEEFYLKHKLISLTRLAKTFLRSSTLHFLAVNVENQTNWFLSQISNAETQKNLEVVTEQPTVCQMYVRLSDDKTMIMVNNILLASSSFVPIYAADLKATYAKSMAFVNVGDRECIELFGLGVVFDSSLRPTNKFREELIEEMVQL